MFSRIVLTLKRYNRTYARVTWRMTKDRQISQRYGNDKRPINQRMSDDRWVKRILIGWEGSKRKRGRPECLDEVKKDLK